MGIDEAGGDGFAGGRDFAVGRSGTQVADCGDAVTGDGDVCGETGGAGAVEDGGIADDQVVAGHASTFLSRRNGL